jgi:hypothetical protein
LRYIIEPIWRGRTAVIIAGGPSVTVRQIRHVAIARLEDRCRIIAVNDAIYLAWNSDWLHAYDSRWWGWHGQRLENCGGIKTTCQEETNDAYVTGKLVRSGVDGFDRSPWAVRGSDGGYQAICIAMHAAVSRILLLGFDMKGDRWFGSHPVEHPGHHIGWVAPRYATLLPFLQERGIETVNCSAASALECFPKAELESVL